jgi:hypothetical protein
MAAVGMGEEFGDAVSRDGNGKIVVSSVDVKSFSPGNAIIRLGTVQLNKISQYLAGLPDTATAELLVCPQDLAKIDGRGLGTWDSSVRRIYDIKGYHGLDGMEIETEKDPTYEQAWATRLKAAFEQARFLSQIVTTGLFMPTKQLVHGRAINSDNVTVETNLYSKKSEIGKQGDDFVESGNAGWLWSSNMHWYHDVYAVNFKDGSDNWGSAYHYALSSRPVALALQP